MMKYQEPEMDIIELEFIDTSAIGASGDEDDGLWFDGPGGNENLTSTQGIEME